MERHRESMVQGARGLRSLNHAFAVAIPGKLSLERSAKAWQGEMGPINQLMLAKYVEDLQSPIYYVAGLPEMTSAMQKMLKNAGKERIGTDPNTNRSN